MGTIDLFADIEIPSNVESEVRDDVLIVKKWNWAYDECLMFQKKAQAFISKNRKLKIYIFCNHPHCFTLGRGNERDQDSLVEFDPALEKKLKYPLYRIHRGGGVTFHYPGQWIFYPIVSINEQYSLDDHMCWQLKSVKEVLKEGFGLKNAMTAKKLMGVWVDKKKIASIGVGLNRFVTEHGLALNLIHDKEMFNELQKINPCGMDSLTYISLSKVSVQNQASLLEDFHKSFLDYISNPTSLLMG